LILQLLHTLVSSQAGAQAFIKITDISSLTEIAPTHAAVLDILSFAWLNSMTVVEDPSALATQIDVTIQSLVSSFTGTDAVTLLEFLGYFLRNANPSVGHLQNREIHGQLICSADPASPAQVAEERCQLYPKPRHQSTNPRGPLSLHKRCGVYTPDLPHPRPKDSLHRRKEGRQGLLLPPHQPPAYRHSLFCPNPSGATQHTRVSKSLEKTYICVRHHLHICGIPRAMPRG
jgi:hypothetical protein